MALGGNSAKLMTKTAKNDMDNTWLLRPVAKLIDRGMHMRNAHVQPLVLLQWGQGGPWPPHFCPILV